MHAYSRRCLASVLVLSLAACASEPLDAPKVPAALLPPATAVPYREAFATGVQIYECARKADATFEWAFKAPEATLADEEGRPLGRHYAGPTWRALDGSTVEGQVVAKAPAPDPKSAIPWLLLSAKSSGPTGLLSGITYIQRIATVGGIAPAEACVEAKLNEVAKVPYTATYFFYR